MNKSWKYGLVLARLSRGYTFREAAKCSSLSRQAIWKRMKKSPEFQKAVKVAREEGRKLRECLLWIS